MVIDFNWLCVVYVYNPPEINSKKFGKDPIYESIGVEDIDMFCVRRSE